MTTLEQIVYYVVDNYAGFLAGSLFIDALSFASESIYENPESINIPIVVKTVNYIDSRQQASVNEVLSYAEALTEFDLLNCEILLSDKEKELSSKTKQKVKVKSNDNKGGEE